MVNDKMCIGIVKDEMMARIDPDIYEAALGKNRMPRNGFCEKAYERICVCKQQWHENKTRSFLLDLSCT